MKYVRHHDAIQWHCEWKRVIYLVPYFVLISTAGVPPRGSPVQTNSDTLL